MKTKLSHLVSILILAAFVLTPAWTPGSRGTFQAVMQAETASPAQATTTRVSVASDGSQGNDESWDPSISADGRFVVFESPASNLVSGDTNNARDIFVHDRQAQTTQRVSLASNGTQGNSGSENPSISANGRFVAFMSLANNLVSGDTNDKEDVFVYDRQTSSTERVSVASNGTQANDTSYGSSLSISADGRYVAFQSSATNLVSGDTNGFDDIFVHDQQTGETERVSVASDGSQGNGYLTEGPSITMDGRYVAFYSTASNLVSGDTNDRLDVFVHDRQTAATERVSVAGDGSQGNDGSFSPSISADGRFIAFSSIASNLVIGDTNGWPDVFVHDRQTGTTNHISVASDGSPGNDDSFSPSISADGRFIAFSSHASNLVSEDTNGIMDAFVHDRQTAANERVSLASDGSQGNDYSIYPTISANGRFIAFESNASNLVIEDTNNGADVFLRDRGEQEASGSLYIPITLNKP